MAGRESCGAEDLRMVTLGNAARWRGDTVEGGCWMLEECHHPVGIIDGVTEGVTPVTPSEAEIRDERADRRAGFLALRAGKA